MVVEVQQVGAVQQVLQVVLMPVQLDQPAVQQVCAVLLQHYSSGLRHFLEALLPVYSWWMF